MRWSYLRIGKQCSDLSRLDDETLVSLAAGNDKDAVETIISRYYPVVKSMSDFCHSKNSFSEAEDLFQEGLIGLLFAIEGYQSDKGASFKTYATTCISRSMIGKIRRDKRSFTVSGDVQHVRQEDLSNISGSVKDDPEQIFILREEVSKLTRIINTNLTSFERKTVIYFLSGYSYAQIASKLNCSSKAVDNALQRVRRKLRT